MSEQLYDVLTEEQAQEQYPGPSEFVHLHNHTVFSMLDGVAQPREYFEGCVDRKWPAFAITEHGVMNSIPDAYLAAKELGVKFIAGCEVYYNDYEVKRQDMLSKGHKMQDLKSENEDLAQRMTRNRHLTVLCKNMTGYENLLKINKYAYEHGFYYRPRTWFDQLAKHKEGLIILSGCLNGPVCHELRAGNLKSKDYVTGAVDYVKKFHSVFGENYYIELQMPGIEGDVAVFKKLVTLADHFKIKLVLSNDCWNPEIPVLTEHGSKELQDLKVGDKVWTHKGRLKQIMCIGKRKVRDKERLFGFLGLNHFVCTENHKIFTRKDKISKPTFKRIDNIKQDDFVCISRIKLPEEDFKEIKISDYIGFRLTKIKDGNIIPHGRAINPVPDKYELTDNILRIIGLYIAEGYVDSYRLGFAFNKNEQEYVDEIRFFFSELGLSPNQNDVTDNGTRIRICCSAWSYFLKAICGNRSYKKKLPPFWTKLSNRQLKILLRAYFDGDGCVKRRVSYTVSAALTVDLAHAMASLDLPVTVTKRKPRENVKIYKKDGSIVYSKLSAGYYMYFPKPSFHGLGYDIGHYDKSKIRTKNFCDKYGFWLINPFKEIKSSLKEVWCIQVEDDSSFLTAVTSSNCHYIQRRDFDLQKVMMAISQNTTVDDPNLFHVNSDEQFFKTRYELRATFARNGYEEHVPRSVFEKACSNTLEVADKCETFKPDLSPKLPNLDNAKERLCSLALKGLKDKGLDKDKTKYLVDGKMVTYFEQMQIELKRFVEKGFASYFLITRELVQESYRNGWPLGPARGSAGGSLVCYLIDIQTLDPIKWGTSFNRFLSPARGGNMLKVTMD